MKKIFYGLTLGMFTLPVSVFAHGSEEESVSLDGKNQSDLNIPQLDNDDAIAYVKQNPLSPDEYVFATYKKDIFMTHDSGKTWIQTVNDGVAENSNHE